MNPGEETECEKNAEETIPRGQSEEPAAEPVEEPKGDAAAVIDEAASDTGNSSTDSAVPSSSGAPTETTTTEATTSSSGFSSGPNVVDALAENLGKTRLEGPRPTQISPPGQSPPLSVASSGSSGGTKASVDLNKPVMKKQLPYMSQEFCERPSKTIQESNLGKKLNVLANFFKIHFPQGLLFHQYDIQYSKRGRKGAMEMKKREDTLPIFWNAVKQNPRLFPHPNRFVYNGVNILYSLDRLNMNTGETRISVTIDQRGNKVELIIKYAGPKQLVPNANNVTDQMNVITVLDEVFSARIRNFQNKVSERFVQHGRSTFFVPDRKLPWDEKMAVSIGEGLEAWTGLHGAVKPNCQLGMLLNVDLGHSVFYKQDYNLIQFFYESSNRTTWGEKSDREMDESLKRCGLDRGKRKIVDNALKGVTLTYRLPNGRERPFKYSAIADKSAMHQMIEVERGMRISIAEYYETQHGIRLNYPLMPCVQLNKAKRTWVPMELVFTQNIPFRLKGKIPDGPLRKMVQKTAFPPLVRKEIILQMAASDGSHPNKPVFLAEQDDCMREFGVAVNREFVTVRASLLPEPNIEFGNNTNISLGHTGEWSLVDRERNTLRKAKLPQPVSVIPSMIFMQAGANREPRHQQNMDIRPLGTLMEVLHHFGLTVPGGRDCFLSDKFDCEVQDWELLLKWMLELKGKVAKQFPGAVPLVVFILPYKCTTRRQMANDYFSEYAMIKYICDVVVGIHAQCVLQKTWGQMSGNPLTCTTAHNVAIKILGKIGVPLFNLQREGIHKNWTRLTDREEPTLLLGIDVTHPGTLDRGTGGHAALSVACVVGNVDLDCSQFETSVRAQCVNEERTVSLQEEISKRITAFTKKTGKMPSHIVIYRDGVSETQFGEVLYEEKNAVKEACRTLDPTYEPTLTYIVLSKRHHTRFFPIQPEDTHGQAYNLKPGTLVEVDVTSKTFFDFYLISQHGPLGTSRPAHYYVLWDEWQPSFAFWQTITHALAYAYVRCPKSISQPAPVMYAHLAAKRAKDYLMAHYEVNTDKLKRMTDYEKYMNIKAHLHQHKELAGMTFV